MHAVILAGGQETRLLPATPHTPKPLLPIVGRPLLSCLVRHFMVQREAPVRVIRETVVRGGSGAVLDLLPCLRSPFLVVSRDAVLVLDARAQLAARRATGGPATLALMAPADRVRFEVAGVETVVTRFIKKPRVSEFVADLFLNSGSYLLEREAFRDPTEDRPPDFEHDVFPALLRTGHRLGVAPILRFWRDIGTPESFRDAHFEALNAIWPWTALDRGAPLAVGPGVTIVGVVGFGDGVLISAGNRIRGRAYLGAGERGDVFGANGQQQDHQAVLGPGHGGRRRRVCGAVLGWLAAASRPGLDARRAPSRSALSRGASRACTADGAAAEHGCAVRASRPVRGTGPPKWHNPAATSLWPSGLSVRAAPSGPDPVGNPK